MNGPCEKGPSGAVGPVDKPATPPPAVYEVVSAFLLKAFFTEHDGCHEHECSHRTDDLMEADRIAAVFVDLHLPDFGLAIVPRAVCVEVQS